MEKKNVFVLALALLALLAIAGCTEPAVTGENAAVQLRVYNANGEIIFDGAQDFEKGTNAFEAMKGMVSVEYEEFDFGAMVTGIEGNSAPEGYYLALHVNGEYASKGITDYTIEEDMLIEWKMEKLEDFGLS